MGDLKIVSDGDSKFTLRTLRILRSLMLFSWELRVYVNEQTVGRSKQPVPDDPFMQIACLCLGKIPCQHVVRRSHQR